MIGEAVLAFGMVQVQKVSHTTHAHVRFLFHLAYCAPLINLIVANAVRGIS
jgi:hypothetical protein